MKKEIREVMYDFIQVMKVLKRRRVDIHQYGKVVMLLLPLLKIKEGYELDFYQLGNNMGSRYEPYVCKAGATEPYIPTVYEDGTPVDFEERHSIRLDFLRDNEKVRKKIHVPYDESKRVVDMLAVHEYDDIPQALPYFEVPFTEDGIMQAWLLDKITLFLPLFWHCLYNKKFFILNNDNIDWGFAESSKDEELKNVKNIITAMDREPLYPIIKIDGDEALLTLTYWNAWRGLVKECIKARRNGTCIVFDEKVERTILVPYESGIRF